MTFSSDALALLTRQHSELAGLLAQLGRTTDPAARCRLVRELSDQLTSHLAAEQEVFYPASCTLISDQVMTEVMIEHVTIKRVLAELLWIEADDPRFDSRVATLVELLDGHAQWQEQELFELVGAALDREQLAVLGARLRSTFAISCEIATAEAAIATAEAA